MEPKVKVIANKQFWLTIHDFTKALVLAGIGSALQIIVSSFDNGKFTLDWVQIRNYAVYGAVTYLIKNFFNSSNTTIEVKHPIPKQIVEGNVPAPAEINVSMMPGQKPVVTTSVG